MSKTEARQHFGSKHIYWHGPSLLGRDPTGRLTPIQNAKRTAQIRDAYRHVDQPNWHDSMSEMLPGDEIGQMAQPVSWTDRWVDIEASKYQLDARWVEIAPVKPPCAIERKPGLVVSPQVKAVGAHKRQHLHCCWPRSSLCSADR